MPLRAQFVKAVGLLGAAAGAQCEEMVGLPGRAVGPARGESQLGGQQSGQDWRGLVTGCPEMTNPCLAKSLIKD